MILTEKYKNRKKIKATISYKMDKDHPDKDCVVGGWRPNKEFHFTDIYYIDPDKFCGESDILSYIKNDLSIIAGGGYNSKHIKNAHFTFEMA